LKWEVSSSETDIGSTNLYTMTILVEISNFPSVYPASFGCHIIGIHTINNRTGIAINRSVEEFSSHKNYFVEYHPRRNRLTHNLIYEEFEMVVEDWANL
jgi:hypothetical protein